MKEAHKHRLIGTAILAAVAVLFLPSFFKDNQAYSVNTESQIPQRPSITALTFRDSELPQGIDPAMAPEAMFVGDEVVESSSMPPPTSASLDDNESVTPPPGGMDAEESVSSEGVSVPMNAQISTPPINEKGLMTGYVVRIASLSSKESAERLESRLLSMGHKAYIRSAPLTNGYTYRIFVGPFLDQAEAASVKQVLDDALSVNSWVQKFEP